MHRPTTHSNHATLLLLLGLTLTSVGIAEWSGVREIAIVAVFGCAVAKGQLIALQFMETRQALPVWNALYRIWIAAIGIALCLGAFLAERIG